MPLPELNQQELEIIRQSITQTFLKKGDYLFHEGDDSKDMFFVEEGQLEVIKKSYDNRCEIRVNLLLPGALIGEMAMVDKKPCSATIRALEDSLISKIPLSVIRGPGTGSASDVNQNTIITNSICSKVSIYILSTISERLRLRTESTVQALQKQLEE